MISQLLENPLVLVCRKLKHRQPQSLGPSSVKNINLNDQVNFQRKSFSEKFKQFNTIRIIKEQKMQIPQKKFLFINNYRTRKNTSLDKTLNIYHQTINCKGNKLSKRYNQYQLKKSQILKMQECLLQPCKIGTITLQQRPETKKKFQESMKSISHSRNIRSVDFKVRKYKNHQLNLISSRQFIEPWNNYHSNQEQL